LQNDATGEATDAMPVDQPIVTEVDVAGDAASDAQAPAIWRTGEPMTLETAVNLALMRNRTIVASQFGVETANLGLQAAGADFELKIIPVGEAGVSGDSQSSRTSVGAGVAVSQFFETGTTVAVTPFYQRLEDDHVASVGLSVSQSLLRGIDRESNLAGIRSAEFAVRSARRSLYQDRVGAILATIRNVYDILRTQRIVELREQSVERLRGYAAAARVREEAGVADPIDVLRANIRLNTLEDQLASSRQSLEDAYDSLRILLNLPIDAAIVVEAPMTYGDLSELEPALTDLALSHRVEMDQTLDAIEESRRRIRLAKHQLLPDLDVTVNYGRSGQSAQFARALRLEDDAWGVALSTSVELSRTAERAAYDASKIGLQVGKIGLSVLEDRIRREVRSDHRRLRRLREQIDVQIELETQARGKRRVANMRFETGIADNFDLIEAETELLSAQTSLIAAVVDYIYSSYQLRATVGTLLERPK